MSTIPQPPVVTFEEIREMFRESARRHQEIAQIVKETSEQMKETDRQQKETARAVKETAEQLKETERAVKETSKQMKETDRKFKGMCKQFGELGVRFGELGEHLVAPGIERIFNEIGFEFDEITANYQIYGDKKNLLTEIDLLLDSDSIMLVVEVKIKPVPYDIIRHLDRIAICRDYLLKNNMADKKIIGAVAGVIFEPKVCAETIAAGFYAITQSGDTVKFATPPNFEPHIF
jgi:hypothetical protein